MTQDERLEAALARLTAALAALESAGHQVLSSDHERSGTAPAAGELEQAKAKLARLEAASDEVSRLLEVATETLATIVARQI